MDRDQSRGGRSSRGRGRASPTLSANIPLRPPPTKFTFSPLLLSSSAHLTGDRSGPSSSPHRIIHTGDGFGSSSPLPHSEFRHEEENNAEDDIKPPLDHVWADAMRYIKPDESGTCHTTAGAIHDAIRAHFKQPWLAWRDIPIEIRERMFLEFKRKVYWLPNNDQMIRRAFELRGMKCFSDIFHQVRRKNTRPPWIGDHVWECLKKHWQSEVFKRKQNQAKETHTSDKGGFFNTCGSISLETHAARIEKETGKRPSRVDLFLLGHKKKNSETRARDQRVDSRAESTYNAFQSLAVEERLIQSQIEGTDESTARTQNPPRSKDELFAEVNGGVYKGRIYRMENQPSRQRSVYSASSSTFVSQAQYDELRHRVTELMQESQKKDEQLTQMMEMIQTLQSKMQKVKKCIKKKKKHRRNEEIDSSSEKDRGSD